MNVSKSDKKSHARTHACTHARMNGRKSTNGTIAARDTQIDSGKTEPVRVWELLFHSDQKSIRIKIEQR